MYSRHGGFTASFVGMFTRPFLGEGLQRQSSRTWTHQDVCFSGVACAPPILSSLDPSYNCRWLQMCLSIWVIFIFASSSILFGPAKLLILAFQSWLTQIWKGGMYKQNSHFKLNRCLLWIVNLLQYVIKSFWASQIHWRWLTYHGRLQQHWTGNMDFGIATNKKASDPPMYCCPSTGALNFLKSMFRSKESAFLGMVCIVHHRYTGFFHTPYHNHSRLSVLLRILAAMLNHWPCIYIYR